MYELYSVIADKNTGKFENHHFLPEILALFDKYKSFLIDDYYSQDNVKQILEIIELINSVYPHFYVVCKNDKFVGFAYLYNWRGNEKNLHSCSITTCIHPDFWGKEGLKAAKWFVNMLFSTYNIKKLKAEVFETNFRIATLLKKLGFQQEAILQNETFRHGKPINIMLYAINSIR